MVSNNHRHHHRKENSAAIFKRKSLASIKNKKVLARVFKYTLTAIALLLISIVFIIYLL